MTDTARRLRAQKAYSTDPAYLERMAREEETRGVHPTNDAAAEGGSAFARRPNAPAAVRDGPNELIGIVLVTHGNLAHELIAALEHVVGPQQGVVAVCIGSDDDMAKRRAEILESAKACDTGDGVVVLTDMFGGTPSNLGISIMEQARVEVLAGVNLPVLVKLASVRNRPIAEAVRMAQEAGRKYITVASRIFAEESL
jgi:PTS system mannose-specific IIA component